MTLPDYHAGSRQAPIDCVQDKLLSTQCDKLRHTEGADQKTVGKTEGLSINVYRIVNNFVNIISRTVAATKSRAIGDLAAGPRPNIQGKVPVKLLHLSRAALIGYLLLAGGVSAQTALKADFKPAGSDWWPEGKQFDPSRSYTFPNAHGQIRLLSSGTRGSLTNLFFDGIGNNGRGCVTCHQPADAMSLSVKSIQARWQQTKGADPLFDVSDGANCPDKPRGVESSHSLLLNRGLFRISRDWPGLDIEGRPFKPNFKIEVVRDPTGCNTSPIYGLFSKTPKISVFRRPRPAANLPFIEAVGFPYDPKTGMPLARDPETRQYVSEALMADSRALTLAHQAEDALQSHMQIPPGDSAELLRALVGLERSLYTAQSHDRWGNALSGDVTNGGPEFLSRQQPGTLQSAKVPIWNEFFGWKESKDPNPDVRAFRQSVARGAELFSRRMFLVKDSAGVNDTIFGNPVRNSCAMCHNMMTSGIDTAPGRVDVGNGNPDFSRVDPELPLFRIQCDKDARPHAFLGRNFLTHDPGYALTTGKCEDVGKIVTQQLRGLAARAPYFSNGSAKMLRDIVDMYDRRYNIRFSEQEKTDLVNLLSVL